jgi:hypothetical protein
MLGAIYDAAAAPLARHRVPSAESLPLVKYVFTASSMQPTPRPYAV